jgi:hypothetical protein
MAQLPASRSRLRKHVEDDWVARTRRHFKRRSDCYTPDDYLGSGHSKSPIGRAIQLRHADDPALRQLTECLLLTTMPFEQVADELGMSLDTLEAYHQIFFDVRPHLGARDWILAEAIRTGPSTNFAAEYPAGLWRTAAYYGGFYVLRAVLAVTGYMAWPSWQLNDSPAENRRANQRLRVKMQLLVNLMTAPNLSHLAQVVELKGRLEAADRPVNGAPPRPTIRSAHEDFLRSAFRHQHTSRRPKKKSDGKKAPAITLDLLDRLDAVVAADS